MKKILSFVMAAAIAFSSSVIAQSERKVSDWAKGEVQKAEELGLIPDKILSEDMTENITREEFASISVKLLEYYLGKELEKPENSPFSDTDDIDVLKAYKAGITTGMSENEFAPDMLLNREQAAVMLARVYKKASFEDGETDKDDALIYDDGERFSDDGDISEWAENSIYFMSANDIIKGMEDGSFAPKKEASREQALLIAVRMAENKALIPDKKEKEQENKNNDPDPYSEAQEAPEKSDGDKYTIAFIGGSLTEGGSTWINKLKVIIAEKMPNKEVVTLNAGKGGTGSDYGAARFFEDVGKYAPDMVVIEFAVNDANVTDEIYSKVYMESMVRQSLKLSKVPNILFLYAPEPWEKTDPNFQRWENGIKYKEEIAKHYGIKSINVYDYMQRDYEKIKAENGYETFTDYLKTMYSAYGSSFDVHGGYKKYAEAIEEAFSKDFDACMTKPNNARVYCTSARSIADARYDQIFVNDKRMQYLGKWETYSKSNKFDGDSVTSIADKHYGYPYFTNGIKQAYKEQAAFGFMTKASAFCLNYPAATAGSNVSVYIDEQKKDTLTCQSQYHAVNYIGKWVSLPNDGKEHKVIMVVEAPTSSSYVFRFGSVIERFE